MTIEGAHVGIAVVPRGEVEDRDIEYAREKLANVVARVGAEVLYAEVKLTMAPDPARERPAIVEAVIDINGRPLRAHVAAADMHAAVDLLDERLRRRIDRSHEVVVEMRHGEYRRHRPERSERPVPEREIVKRKTFASGALSVDEAADLLDLLGHDFLLFANVASGQPAVIAVGDDGLELSDASDLPTALPPETVARVRLSGQAVRRCTVAEAEAELDLDLTPFVFFVDADSGTGSVVYNRYDGDYGLITLAT